jgi:hypothetical protein
MTPARGSRDKSARELRYHRQTKPDTSLLTAAAFLLAAGLAVAPNAAQQPSTTSAIVDRVVARVDPPPQQYRALRRLEAQSDKLGGSAWIEAWTEVEQGVGFRYEIVSEGGSSFVRGKVLKPWLENEKKMWASGDPERASFTHDNYTFDDRGPTADGLVRVAVKSRRKDLLLVDGSIFVNPGDGDLVRIEGRLSKNPSFWTRRVEVVRHYQRIQGVRVPIAIESVANVLMAGRSTFKMTYDYATINGVQVGAPRPLAAPVP